MNTYKYETRDLCVSKGWNTVSVDKVWLLFTEEIGELASAIRQEQKIFKKCTRKAKGQDVMVEMGDVFSYLFQIADILNVDLDEMWKVHRKKVEKRSY
jgi:NTP pyrophosphatase (non-canonical NTP hydrolase)